MGEKKSEVVGVKGSRPACQRQRIPRVFMCWQPLPACVGVRIFKGPEQRIRRHSRTALEERGKKKLGGDYRVGAGSEAALFRGHTSFNRIITGSETLHGGGMCPFLSRLLLRVSVCRFRFDAPSYTPSQLCRNGVTFRAL